jgi:hypothetical protein
MKTKNQKGGAIFTLLAGLIASAIAAGLLKLEEGKYRNENPRDHVAESIKSGYNLGSRSFINIMQYHRGLLHQCGHGWGALAK